MRNRPALREIVAAIVVGHEIAALSRIFDRVGVPFSPVNTPFDLFADPQVLAHALPIRMPAGDVANLPPLPVAFDDAVPGVRCQPPGAGEHTDAILAGLGYAEERIAALRRGGAVG